MKILIDLDCYFVSAERTIDPSLLGKCVAVGGRNDPHIFSAVKTQQTISLSNSGAFVPSIILDGESKKNNYFVDPDGKVRGILTTCSYEARAMGVKTPMPIAQALQLCPDLIILPPSFKLYHKLSNELKFFLEKRIPVLEQFSIDEFFGDLGGWIADEEVAPFIENLKIEIMETFNLPLSIGASPSKWTAKLATSMAKPFGTKVIWPHEHYETVKDIPIEKFPGIGRKLQERFHSMQFSTLKDIIHARDYFESLTPSMRSLWHRVNGSDNEPVKEHKERQSIGVSRTFDAVVSRLEIRRRLSILSRHLSFTVFRSGVNPTNFSLYIRYELKAKAKGHIKTKRQFSEQLLKTEILRLFDEIDNLPTYHIISISLSVGSFSHQTKQGLDMFALHDDQKSVALSKGTQEMKEKYGVDILRWGLEIEKF